MVSVSDLLSFKSSSHVIRNKATKAYAGKKIKIGEGSDVDIDTTEITSVNLNTALISPKFKASTLIPSKAGLIL